MPEKNVPAPFGALPAHFFHGPEKSENCPNFAYFPWWTHGPYSPGLGPLLLSTLIDMHDRSKGPCDVFHFWVRWQRSQVGI